MGKFTTHLRTKVCNLVIVRKCNLRVLEGSECNKKSHLRVGIEVEAGGRVVQIARVRVVLVVCARAGSRTGARTREICEHRERSRVSGARRAAGTGPQLSAKTGPSNRAKEGPTVVEMER